ncbi:hypothetical protein M0802_009363 [Mischocyttarus mexicanus]|nr:hypothetical protein M0802_009363 [Mischocyttarus mexicanus]
MRVKRVGAWKVRGINSRNFPRWDSHRFIPPVPAVPAVPAVTVVLPVTYWEGLGTGRLGERTDIFEPGLAVGATPATVTVTGKGSSGDGSGGCPPFAACRQRTI